MTSHPSTPLRQRALLLGALLLAFAAFAMANARAADASVWYFCPHNYSDQFFPSGDTCTAQDAGAYHHLDSVQAAEFQQGGPHRKCANWRHSPGGDIVGAWKCNTVPYDSIVTKYPGGDAGYGTIHNGDPAGFRMFGIENF